MENIFVEFLPPWVETGIQPAFYDKESGTVLQQTARMYARVNMLIRMFNKLSKNTVETVNEYITKFNELHDYVQDYFENLDVQEEINNKLDQMAEDGVLTDIIAQYLTLAGVLAYSTVAELSNANNLAIGSKAKTYGYLRQGDGVYNLYIIREILNTDVVDGYNIVSIINSDNLIAERLQTGRKAVINLLPSDNIQNYLNLSDDKIIYLPRSTSYTVSNKLFINSDTTLDLNGSTLNLNYDSETLYHAYKLTDTFTGYNGYSNITIRNGKINGGCGCFMHNKNVLIENIEFENINSRHALQIAGCYNFTINNCIFNGTKYVNDTGNECINIDPCNYGGQPYMAESSPMYDHTKNEGITIANNIFKSTETDGQKYVNAIGSHGADDEDQIICNNLIIKNNDFGSPYSHCINICDYTNVSISDNKIEYDTSDMLDDSVHFIYIRNSYLNLDIINNSIKYPTTILYTQDSEYNRTNLTISNNRIKSDDSNRGSIWLRNTNTFIINDNKITTTVCSIFLDCCRNETTPIVGTETNNGYITNNTFTNTTASTAGMIKIRGNVHHVVINNNSFIRYDATNYIISTDSFDTLNEIKVMGNNSNYKTHYIPSTLISKNVCDNNALFDLSSLISTQNVTIDLNANLTNFKKIIALIGSAGSNYHPHELLPFITDGEYLPSSTIKWKVIICNSSDNVSVCNLESASSGAQLKYDGAISIRKVYGCI